MRMRSIRARAIARYDPRVTAPDALESALVRLIKKHDSTSTVTHLILRLCIFGSFVTSCSSCDGISSALFVLTSFS